MVLNLERVKLKFKLETLTHVHIGGPETLPGVFYFFDGKNFHRLKDEAVFGRINFEDPEVLTHFYNEDGDRKFDPKSDVLYTLEKYGNWDPSRVNKRDIRVLIRHPNGNAYIPGSSLKGALRLLLTIHRLKRDRSRLKRIEDAVRKTLADFLKKYNEGKVKRCNKKISQYAKVSDRKLEDFINDILVGRIEGIRARRQNRDCLRTIVVSDSNLIEKTRMGMAVIFRENGSFRSPFLIELIPPRTYFEFEGYYDVSLAKKLGCPNILDEIKQALEVTGSWMAKDETERLRNFHSISHKLKEIQFNLSRANLHIGYGGSLENSSLFKLLSPDVREMILKCINTNKMNRRGYTLPYTRRMVAEFLRGFRGKDLLGWVSLEIQRY